MGVLDEGMQQAASLRQGFQMARDHLQMDLFYRLPWMLLALGIALGAIIVGWLMRKLTVGCAGCVQSKRPYQRRPARSAIYLVGLTLQLIIVLGGIGIAFAVAGVNFFSIAFSVGVVSIVLTYGGQSIIVNTASGMAIFATDKMEIGDEVELPSMGVRGTVADIRPMYTIIEETPTSGAPTTRIHVPNNALINSVVKFTRKQQPSHVGYRMMRIPKKK